MGSESIGLRENIFVGDSSQYLPESAKNVFAFFDIKFVCLEVREAITCRSLSMSFLKSVPFVEFSEFLRALVCRTLCLRHSGSHGEAEGDEPGSPADHGQRPAKRK